MFTDANTVFLDMIAESNSILLDYDNYVVKGKTREIYDGIIQTGKKAGESLFHHVMNGVLFLDTLRPQLALTEVETRVLYTAFTIHDLNKVTDEKLGFNKLATPERVAEEIERLHLSDFFPEWAAYLQDMTSLIRGHGAHSSVSGETLIPKLASRYGLSMERVRTLTHLMRAADVIGLSHSLGESTYKSDSLSHLNRYFTDSNMMQQYEFRSHQVVEQRGLLTNVIHNVAIQTMESYGWLPVLLYADGVAYLAPKGADTLTSAEEVVQKLGAAVSLKLKRVIAGRPADLIEQTAQGIKFKPDAFSSGQSFESLFAEAYNIIARRRFKREDLESKARQRVQENLKRLEKRDPQASAAFSDAIEHRTTLMTGTDEQMQSAELVRTYFIFLNDHAPHIANAWHRLYALLELSSEQHAYYDLFDVRYDRPYILAGDIPLSQEEVYARLIDDGTEVWEYIQQTAAQDDSASLWAAYVKRYLLLDGLPVSGPEWGDHLAHYVENQHHQCVHCSSPFPTQLWRSADVRDGIEVQKFSNRLAGGGNREPVKSICQVCRAQFLLEALTYPAVRNENLFYLHLFPMTFQTQAFVRGMSESFERVRVEGISTLHLDLNAALNQMMSDQPLLPRFNMKTKAGKPHPYGIYVPQYDEAVAGVLVLPLNAPGDNETERYLFALQYALILRSYFGARIVLTRDPTPPLTVDHLPDLFLDMTPMSCAGLLPYNAYRLSTVTEDTTTGALDDLWDAVLHLIHLRTHLSPAEDILPELVRALSGGPLNIFYAADRIVERDDRFIDARFTLDHLVRLAITIGGDRMKQLSEALAQLAALAWENRIRGRTLERSSLLYPVTTLFEKLNQQRREHDREFIIAATCEEIFAHLERIQEGEFKIGRNKQEAIEHFVRSWYQWVVDDVYGGQTQRLLADKKLLLSAYLFYVKAQIPRKSQDTKESV